jgi:hypothetical protein
VSGTASPLKQRANVTRFLPLYDVVPERFYKAEDEMITGTLIDDLLAAVERAEQNARLACGNDDMQERVPAVVAHEVRFVETSLQGVA